MPLIYLILALFTLSDYGINWDAPKHFIRGQSYLHFILTGKRDFLDLPAYPNLKGAPDYVDFNVDVATNSVAASLVDRDIKDPNVRRSYFQSDFYTFDYFMTKHIHTHPEVNNLLLAFSNFIFYQRLGIMGDIEAYHLYIIVTVFLLISGIALWVNRNFGLFPSMVASATLALYPLVFAESHFNFKDPVLMSFFGLSILSFWYGILKNEPKLILLSAIFTGFGLGTKFNTIFLTSILGFWLLFFWTKRISKKRKKVDFINFLGGWRIIISLLLFPLISLGILYLFSPYLWLDPVRHLLEIINFYKEIGTETADLSSRYIFGGFNIYPLVWILYTTPLPILFLSILGISYSLFLLFKQKDDIVFLVLIWLTVPIVRVMWPGTNIYGGVRQIMEFIPALAIFSGIGAFFIIKLVSKFYPKLSSVRQVIILLIALSLFFTFFELTKIHPNENVYFNQLTGGLNGAYKKQIPSWGNSFGSVYLQGINWLNKNTEQNANLVLPVNYISSIPRLKLRGDIDLNNAHFSGIKREGEYAMELSYDWPLKSRYKYSYYENFLSPVYQVEVDGIPLLKIWKNDLEHTKVGYEKEIIIEPSNVLLSQDNKKLKIDFEEQISITRLIVDHSLINCQPQDGVGYIETSTDGENWKRESEPIFNPESPEQYLDKDEDTFVIMFAGKSVESVILNSELSNSCILKDYKVTIMGLLKALN